MRLPHLPVGWPSDEALKDEAAAQKGLGYADTAILISELGRQREELRQQIKQLQGLIKFHKDICDAKDKRISALSAIIRKVQEAVE